MGVFHRFFKQVYFFLANATCISSMSFWRLDYCLTKFLGKKIDFSLEVHKTEISQMDLLSTMRQSVISTIRNLFLWLWWWVFIWWQEWWTGFNLTIIFQVFNFSLNIRVCLSGLEMSLNLFCSLPLSLRHRHTNQNSS